MLAQNLQGHEIHENLYPLQKRMQRRIAIRSS